MLRAHYVFPKRVCLDEAKKAVLTALHFDPQLAEAHVCLGQLTTIAWDRVRAEKELKRAIALNQNCGRAHQWYGVYLRTVGRFEEAMGEIERAHEIDPLSLNINSSRGILFYCDRQYEQALTCFKTIVALDPNYAMTYFYLGLTYEAMGRYDEALSQFQKALALLGFDAEISGCIGRVHALSGRRDDARASIDELKGLSEERYAERYFVALIYEALDEKDQAFEWLEKGYEEHDEGLALLQVDPRLDRLRSDSRFIDLLERVGL